MVHVRSIPILLVLLAGACGGGGDSAQSTPLLFPTENTIDIKTAPAGHYRLSEISVFIQGEEDTARIDHRFAELGMPKKGDSFKRSAEFAPTEKETVRQISAELNLSRSLSIENGTLSQADQMYYRFHLRSNDGWGWWHEPNNTTQGSPLGQLFELGKKDSDPAIYAVEDKTMAVRATATVEKTALLVHFAGNWTVDKEKREMVIRLKYLPGEAPAERSASSPSKKPVADTGPLPFLGTWAARCAARQRWLVIFHPGGRFQEGPAAFADEGCTREIDRQLASINISYDVVGRSSDVEGAYEIDFSTATRLGFAGLVTVEGDVLYAGRMNRDDGFERPTTVDRSDRFTRYP